MAAESTARESRTYQRGDNVTQCQQAAVDVDAFTQATAHGTRLLGAFRARQVHQMELGSGVPSRS